MRSFSTSVSRRRFYALLLAIACLGHSTAQPTRAEKLRIFISAFASGDAGAIHACDFDANTGAIATVHRTVEVEHPFFLALSPDKKFLYSIDTPQFGGKENENIAAFAIGGNLGKLESLGRQSALGTAACYLDVDASGKTLLVANYSSGSVASLPIQKDGSLGKAATFVQHEGSSVNPARQKEPHAHCIVVSPDNRFAYAADLGIDKILAYRLNSTAATIDSNAPPFATTDAGSGPRHLTFHPNGKRLYVINELANTITNFGYDAKSGRLTKGQSISTLPDDFKGTSYTADLKVTPNGRFLYGTNRGHDSIASYQIAADGSLKRLAITPSNGAGPQNLAITPDGKWLICANMPGNNVVVFKIHSDSGVIEQVGEPMTMPTPSCILIR
jgi:6-phosphogluconolactonase